jgi:hypothetical protein
MGEEALFERRQKWRFLQFLSSFAQIRYFSSLSNKYLYFT